MTISSPSTSDSFLARRGLRVRMSPVVLCQRPSRTACTNRPLSAAHEARQEGQTASISICHHQKYVLLTYIACLYTFSTVRNISPASRLVSFAKELPMLSSCGKERPTILSKSARFSPDLNLYILHSASKHCTPAKTEAISPALSNSRVISRKSGHLEGKSYASIFWRVGISCTRTWGEEATRMGTRRVRKDLFSSSGMGFAWLYSSAGDQPFDMRFLR